MPTFSTYPASTWHTISERFKRIQLRISQHYKMARFLVETEKSDCKDTSHAMSYEHLLQALGAKVSIGLKA